MEITDRELLNGTVATGEDVVVRVDLANFYPARGRVTLNLTADGTLLTRRSVTVGVDERRTVYLRAVPSDPGRYDLRLDGVPVGTVTVTAAVESTTASPGSSPRTGTTPGTVATTSGATATDWETPTGTPGTQPIAPAGTTTGTGTAAPLTGPAGPSRTDTVVAAGMSLMLLYGVGVAVYVLRKHPPSGLN